MSSIQKGGNREKHGNTKTGEGENKANKKGYTRWETKTVGLEHRVVKTLPTSTPLPIPTPQQQKGTEKNRAGERPKTV